ncbi:class I SAM-dependent methyltransferase [Polynucleobacter sp. HIN5]|uniref:class I SAM-dependent methyltransferase n=1 Tax=Polynucleobacter sp. HIN5 TaxID=3047864 RepID=UPI002573CA9E|nr:class I SAM-dependent methyltransferase [Polynucleobacter sp. HIN5]BEI32945.1 hypothetical protein PHIN5_03130 [Polynucleobacter sp. HIN5]
MQEDDKTPLDWDLPVESLFERIFKKPIRSLIYPLYLNIRSEILKKKYGGLIPNSLKINLFIYGTRGLEYQILRKLLNRYSPLKNKSILIAGCGTGRDIPSWLKYSPEKLFCIDFYSYKRSWDTILNYYKSNNTKIHFMQQDLEHMENIPSDSLDIIGSDAVFEHLANLSAVLSECYRILKPDGILYANFGPLWRTWSGDHISGFDGLGSGFNHLLLNEENYKEYIKLFGDYTHNEHDGRTWIYSNMFSYLVAEEYIEKLEEQGFQQLHLSCSIDPGTIKFLKKYPIKTRLLLSKYKKSDLLIAGLTIIYKKPSLKV